MDCLGYFLENRLLFWAMRHVGGETRNWICVIDYRVCCVIDGFSKAMEVEDERRVKNMVSLTVQCLWRKDEVFYSDIATRILAKFSVARFTMTQTREIEIRERA